LSENINELLIAAKNGDNTAVNEILINYKHLVAAISRKYYLLGGDREDLVQEGMIGLFKAINSFDNSKNDSFKNYAMKIVEREIISAIRRENANKNRVLDESVLIEDIELLHNDNDPETDIITEENCKELSGEILQVLSGLEKKVVKLYLKGYLYTDIAKMLGKTPKSIDNALTRIKSKLRYLKERL